MLNWFRRRQLLSQVAFLLLAVGVLIQPVLNAAGDVHELDHLAQIAAHEGADHPPHDENDPFHALGAHALLHQSACSAHCAMFAPLDFVLIEAAPIVLPPASTSRPVLDLLTLPFRPPIA